MSDDPIVSFFEGGPDDRGRTLAQILATSDRELEATHDYIQWVFPTAARSGVNPRAPLVTPATARTFAERPDLRERLRGALDRMLRFYGLMRDGSADEPRIVPDPERFGSRADEWLRPHNHNHLRLTRIMQSLDALGLPAEARALQRCLLEDVYDGPGSDRVSRETYEYWLVAVRR